MHVSRLNPNTSTIEDVKQIISAVLGRIKAVFRVIASWMHYFEEWSITFSWDLVGQRLGYGRRFHLGELHSTYPQMLAGEIIYDIGRVYQNQMDAIAESPLDFSPVYERNQEQERIDPPQPFDYIGNALMMYVGLPIVTRPSDYAINRSRWLGISTCRFSAKSEHLRCTPNADGPCEGCKHYEPC